MKIQVYRATRNVLPNQITDFYSPQESNYRHGNGMYFALQKKYSEQFVARESGFAVLGYFQLELESVIKYHNGHYLVDPNSELGKLQQLFLSIQAESNSLFKSFGFKSVQDNPEYDLANNEIQNQILQETIKYNDQKESALQNTPTWEKYQSLRQLSQKVFLQFDQELSKVDAVVSTDDSGDYTGEISLKNPKPITLLSFDLHCSEQLANLIKDEIKAGELVHSGLNNIPGEYADLVSKFLK